MKKTLQNTLLLFLAMVLMAPQSYAVGFCTCEAEFFEETCPCDEGSEKTECPSSSTCTETLDFAHDDFLPKQGEFRISPNSLDLDPASDWIVQRSDKHREASRLLRSDKFENNRPDFVLQVSCVFARFTSLRV